jgi:hypothetical protein
MSDQGSLTRKSMMSYTAVFTGSSVVYLVSLVSALIGGFTGWDVAAAVSFLLGLFNMRSAWKGYSDMEYGKANQGGLIASAASIGAAIMGFLM